jgi:glycosyltransferase involved in cell wall biosynthesis
MNKEAVLNQALEADSSRAVVIVLTPTKNEARIIRRFLECCSMFADQIIILDQNSEDETVAIAKRFRKAVVHENFCTSYDEGQRQKQLLEFGRQIKAERRIFLTLDADEIPTANILTSPEWGSVLKSPPGTVLCMPRLEILPSFQQVLFHDRWTFGCVDDGIDHSGDFIHSVRIPIQPKRTELATSQIRVLHYSFVRWELQAAKNRFYCVKENLHVSRNLMQRRALYRYDFIENRIRSMKSETFKRDWIANYEAQGIDMTSILVEHPNWLDKQSETDMIKAGCVRFHFDPVWNRIYESDKNKNHFFCRPPRGLARCLVLVDSLYAICPFKRLFEKIMEAVLKFYIFSCKFCKLLLHFPTMLE